MNISPEVQAVLDEFAAKSELHAEIAEWTAGLIRAYQPVTERFADDMRGAWGIDADTDA